MITVKALLDNFQLNSYAYKTTKKFVFKEEKVNIIYTRVTWKLPKSSLSLLKRAMGLNTKLYIE